MKINIGKYKKNGNPRTEKIQIDTWDTWSMDHNLSLIIIPMLKQLKETKRGAPGSMSAFGMQSNMNRQQCFNFYEDGDELSDKIGFEQWDEIMDKMIWSFEELIRDDPPEFWITKPIWHDNWEDNWSDFAPDNEKSPGCKTLRLKREGKMDHKAWKEYEDRIQDGLDLFGSHFRGLWC